MAINTDLIQINTESITPCRQRLAIMIPSLVVDQTFKQIERKYLNHVQVPGFRPGKAPRILVQNRYGESIKAEIKQELVGKAYDTALKRLEINPLSIPVPSMPEVESGKDYQFSLEFDTAPQFELPNYKGIQFNINRFEMDDSIVDAAMEKLRREYSTVEKADKLVEPEDMLKISYSSVTDFNEEIPDSAAKLLNNQDTYIVLSIPETIPGFTAALTGASIGKEVTFEIIFPGDFKEPFLAGKSSRYTCIIHEVYKRILPELTDDFAKRLKVESVAELRENIRAMMVEELRQSRQATLEEQAVEILITQIDFALPQEMLQSEIESYKRSIYQRLESSGISPEQREKNDPEIQSSAQQYAHNKIKLGFIIAAIAEHEKIQINPVELDAMLANYENYFRDKADTTEKRAALRNSLELSLLEKTVLNKLIEWGEIIENDSVQGDASHQK